MITTSFNDKTKIGSFSFSNDKTHNMKFKNFNDYHIFLNDLTYYLETFASHAICDLQKAIYNLFIPVAADINNKPKKQLNIHEKK